MADLESQHRRELIRELIVEELRADGSLDDGELVTYWMTLVATHGTDEEDGDEVGPVYHVLSGTAGAQALRKRAAGEALTPDEEIVADAEMANLEWEMRRGR